MRMLINIVVLVPWIVVTLFLLFLLLRNKVVEFDTNNTIPEIDEDTQILTVASVDGKAYWVHENTFYQTNLLDGGEPDFESAEPVDTMALSPKDINKLLIILDNLKE
jgi:hypothetical protein